VLFEHFGPYHVARIHGAMNFRSDVFIAPVELFGQCETYAWSAPDGQDDIGATVVFENDHSRESSRSEIRKAIHSCMNEIKPDVVAVHGWSLPGTVATIRWAHANDVPVVVMSESRAADAKRSKPKEFLKSKVLEYVAAGLVGAQSHVDYLVQLGLSSEAVFNGYDAVDNDYFEKESARIREAFKIDTGVSPLPYGFPNRFFFASCRFVEKKNLSRLLNAYARYSQTSASPWGLVIAGDGPLKSELLQQIERLDLSDAAYLPGFVQYDELPKYYGLASAFVHVSTVEQWGLVVNEAAASGLPLVVSTSTGSAECLVDHGVNGFLCDSQDTESIAESLTNVASLGDDERKIMGDRSQQIVSGYGPEQFGEGLVKAAEYAMENPQKPSMIGRVVVSLLS